jgi:hypothetical protein
MTANQYSESNDQELDFPQDQELDLPQDQELDLPQDETYAPEEDSSDSHSFAEGQLLAMHGAEDGNHPSHPDAGTAPLDPWGNAVIDMVAGGIAGIAAGPIDFVGGQLANGPLKNVINQVGGMMTRSVGTKTGHAVADHQDHQRNNH